MISPDLRDGLLSTSQLDRELNATTVQSYSRSISFVPDQRQEQILQMLFEAMSPENVIADGEMNENGHVHFVCKSISGLLYLSQIITSSKVDWFYI